MAPEEGQHPPAEEIELEELLHGDDRSVFIDDADDYEWTA